ncbi:CsbD family protein [Acetobacter sacchari]|uniref:CsbD family protein n=1 Tax=Acetobacter sacchari TaxID=2661687 RepID=A0ABS3LV15_9PROT|nr:CsbD family protein [Acetobacter sacchari]MBO1359756.1 CsbD family protein [Acetobacter sacchari]
MGELTDKVKGTLNKAVGSIKEEVGKATNNPELEAEGSAQKIEGHVDTLKGTVKGKINDL